MNFPIGTLDRTATLYSITSAPGAGGFPVNTLVKQGIVYVRRDKDVSASTVIAAGRDAVDIEDVFIMRYVPTLQPGYQIEVEGVMYRIIKASELGRREGLRIWCRSQPVQ